MASFAVLSNNTFLKAPVATGTEAFAVAGIAWDGCVTNRPGARFGPRAIREASHMLCDGIHPHFNITPLGCFGGFGDAGDLPLPITSIERRREAMTPHAERPHPQPPRGLVGRRPLHPPAPAARLQSLAGQAAGGGSFRRPLRHLGQPLRRTQRPRDLGL